MLYDEVRNWKGSILACYSDTQVLTTKRDNKWFAGNCNWRQRESNVRHSSYRYKQVEQNYVREIQSISYDHSADLIVLEPG